MLCYKNKRFFMWTLVCNTFLDKNELEPKVGSVPETDIGNARSCGRLVVTKERKGVPTDCRLLPDYRAICLYNKSP